MAFVRSYDKGASCASVVRQFLARIARAIEGGGVINPPTPSPDRPPRAAIGSNLQQMGTSVLADLFRTGVTWQNENAGYAYGPAPLNAAAGSSYRLNLSPPYADGEWHVMTWIEPGNATGVSTWRRQYTNADLNNSGTRFESVVESYANGVFSARFRFHKRADRGNPAAVIRWAGSGSIELVAFRPEALSPDEHFNPQIVAVSSELSGNIRALDLGGGNLWDHAWTWATRTRTDRIANKGASQPSVLSFEQWLELSSRTNRDFEWIITHRTPKDTVQAMAVAIMTGEGLDDGVPLPEHLDWYVELCSNESWHPDLTGAYQDLAAIGFATGYTGNNTNYARLYAQEARSRQVSQWIAEAIPEYMHRVVRIIGLSPANDMNDYLSLTANDKSYFDAVTKSIYQGIYAKGNYGDNTPAEIEAAWAADAKEQVDNFIRNSNVYRADGKRVLCYEVGSDTARVPWGYVKRGDWLASPQFAAIYYPELLRAAQSTRDRLNLYFDFGPTYEDSAFGAWGHYPGQKWDIAKQVQAALDAST